jgi:hypothetical protein
MRLKQVALLGALLTLGTLTASLRALPQQDSNAGRNAELLRRRPHRSEDRCGESVLALRTESAAARQLGPDTFGFEVGTKVSGRRAAPQERRAVKPACNAQVDHGD